MKTHLTLQEKLRNFRKSCLFTANEPTSRIRKNPAHSLAKVFAFNRKRQGRAPDTVFAIERYMEMMERERQ